MVPLNFKCSVGDLTCPGKVLLVQLVGLSCQDAESMHGRTALWFGVCRFPRTPRRSEIPRNPKPETLNPKT